MTRHKYRNNMLASLHYLSWNTILIESELTFISPVYLRFTDEGRTIALIGAQENISWVGVASSNVTIDVLITAAVMPFILVPLTEETSPLFTEKHKFTIFG